MPGTIFCWPPGGPTMAGPPTILLLGILLDILLGILLDLLLDLGVVVVVVFHF